MATDITPEQKKQLWLDDIIKRLNSLYGSPNLSITQVMNAIEVTQIIQQTSEYFMTESNLVEAEAPIKVIGDIHAQFQDLNKLFDLIGRVPDEKLMFLGDYVDRGPQGIEVLILLFTLKLRYPDRIYLLRGNHETPSVNILYGFKNECIMKYGLGMWWDFQACFNRMPMAGLISKKVLCMHGGLSPEVTSLDVIRNIYRPCEPIDKGILMDLLWSDPTNKGEGWYHSIRGVSYMFGKSVVQQACTVLGIDLIIRAHQVVQDGYEIMEGRRLITVFSAPNYCGQFANAAAVVCLDSDLTISFQQMHQEAPKTGKIRACPNLAGATKPDVAKADKEFIKPFTGFKKVEKPVEPPVAEKPAGESPAPAAEKPNPDPVEKTAEAASPNEKKEEAPKEYNVQDGYTCLKNCGHEDAACIANNTREILYQFRAIPTMEFVKDPIEVSRIKTHMGIPFSVDYSLDHIGLRHFIIEQDRNIGIVKLVRPVDGPSIERIRVLINTKSRTGVILAFNIAVIEVHVSRYNF